MTGSISPKAEKYGGGGSGGLSRLCMPISTELEYQVAGWRAKDVEEAVWQELRWDGWDKGFPAAVHAGWWGKVLERGFDVPIKDASSPTRNELRAGIGIRCSKRSWWVGCCSCKNGEKMGLRRCLASKPLLSRRLSSIVLGFIKVGQYLDHRSCDGVRS